MTFEEKKAKLARAVKAYRGLYDPDTTIWKYPPQPSKQQDVIRWLYKLGFVREEIRGEMRKIDSFKKCAEFEAWIKTITQNIEFYEQQPTGGMRSQVGR